MQIRKLGLSISVSPLWHGFLVNRILTGGCYKSVYSKIMRFRRKFISEMKKLKVQWVQYLLRGTTSTRWSIYCLMQWFFKSHLALFLSWLTIVCTILTLWVSASTAMQRGSECIQAFGCCIENLLCDRQFTRLCCWCLLTKLSGGACSSLIDKMKMIMSINMYFLRTVT